MRGPAVLIACCALAAALAAGCGGSSGSDDSGPTRAEATRDLAGAPRPLAALHAQGNELLQGGQPAYDKRIATLRGYPVVANVWASWCGPCKEEFPVFERTAVRLGTRVGFLGVNSEDNDGDARDWLSRRYVAYPSYVDKDSKIARAVGVRAGIPFTVFYDTSGRVAYVHQGPYRSDEDLARDIRTYAQGS